MFSYQVGKVQASSFQTHTLQSPSSSLSVLPPIASPLAHLMPVGIIAAPPYNCRKVTPSRPSRDQSQPPSALLNELPSNQMSFVDFRIPQHVPTPICLQSGRSPRLVLLLPPLQVQQLPHISLPPALTSHSLGVLALVQHLRCNAYLLGDDSPPVAHVSEYLASKDTDHLCSRLCL